jgi:hypothetical protein
MYKQTFLSYHIAQAEDFEALLSVVEQHGPLISYSRPQPEEYNRNRCAIGIKRIMAGGPINMVTRAEGFRAKVAELILAKNYGEPLPKVLV